MKHFPVKTYEQHIQNKPLQMGFLLQFATWPSYLFTTVAGKMTFVGTGRQTEERGEWKAVLGGLEKQSASSP